MKVLFVGEGAHDIGPADPGLGPRPARGVVTTLTRKLVPAIDQTCKAVPWAQLVRFDPAAKKADFAGKVRLAAILSSRRFDCTATVCVADRDGDDERLPRMLKGREDARPFVDGAHKIVCGLAVESIEAWTLGVPEAIAEELGLEANAVRNEYPKKIHVELLSERSGKPEHRPKALLERIAQLKHRSDSTEFREAVAKRTDIAALMRACPQGFKPFAEDLQNVFEAEASDKHE
jgi:hypothetical protein